MVMILSSHFVFSQKQTFTGTVTDAKTAEPISGVSVKLKGKAAGTMTAQDGSFSISAQPGDVLEISFVGFKTESVKLTSVVWDLTFIESGNIFPRIQRGTLTGKPRLSLGS